MLGRVAALAAPRVVLLSARALAAHHVGIGTALAGVVDRLVHIQHDVVLGGLLDHVPVVVDHELAPVRMAFTGQVGHVPGLDRVESQALVHRERAVHLPLVILNAARRLVVHDEVHAFRLRVTSELDDVVVGIGLRE